jgi:hypothetical protein
MLGRRRPQIDYLRIGHHLRVSHQSEGLAALTRRQRSKIPSDCRRRETVKTKLGATHVHD